MKKLYLCVAIYLSFCFLLCSCTRDRLMNILLFTDNLNSLYEADRYSLNDYVIIDGEHQLLLKENGFSFLLSLKQNDGGLIESLRVTLSKVNESGKKKAVTDKEALAFKKSVCNIITAYTYFSKDDAQKITDSLLPEKGAEYTKCGEVKLEKDNFTFIFYSNEIGCFFRASNAYLLKEEATEKPVSRPLYGETTFKRVNP